MPHHFNTLQLHAGQEVEKPYGARAPPIYATTSYVFDSSKHAAQLCNMEAPGYIYSRIMNPTNDVFEKRMAALEGGVGALAVSSGQAAQFLAITGLAHTGDNIVTTSCLYGGSYNQFKVTLKRLGIEARFVNGDDPEEFAKLIDPKTKAIYFESIGNPKYNVPDIERIGKIAHDKGIPVVVDNTFGAGGYLINTIKHGVDIVVHSATKWIGGHGTTIAGVIIDSGKFPWAEHAKKFPQLSEPSESYNGLILNEVFGNQAFIGHVRIDLLRDMGSCLNPFAAFLLLQGLETLSLRVERQSYNAQRLAEYLKSSEYVCWVSYVGLPSHESHTLAKKYFNHGDKFGGILSFGVNSLDLNSKDSSPEAAAHVVDNLELASNLANVGDSKTLVIAPYYTTHNQLAESEKNASGVSKDLIRVSVGTEHIDDIIEDFEKAFKIVYDKS